MNRTIRSLAVPMIAALLAACSSAPPPAGGPAAATRASADHAGAGDALLGRDWVFVELAGFEGPLPSPPPIAGFILTREALRMTGTTGCNRMGGGYQLDDASGTLRFTGLRNTRMMCDRTAADTEEAVLAAMLATDGFRIRDGTLELLSNGSVVAKLIQPPAKPRGRAGR